MNTKSPQWKCCNYVESRISFTTLCLQSSSRTVEKSFIKSSGRNDVIYSGIEDKSVYFIVETSVTKKWNASKFQITFL